MTGTANQLPQSYYQRHDFYLHKKAFLAQLTDKNKADDYQARHKHLDLDRRIALVEGQNV